MMIRKLRWQIALAVAGLLSIAGLLVFVSGRVVTERPARGGRFVEAILGRPQTYFPILARSDTELSLARLIFSGLTRPDPANPGQFIPDAAERVEISADGRSYTFYLRQDLRWHDGETLNADDILFTVELLKSPEIPDFEKVFLAEPWQDVDVERLDDLTVRISLPEPYAPFLSATTVSILPAHILAGIPHADIAHHRFSTLAPIGTGPFRLEPRGEGGLDSDILVRFASQGTDSSEAVYLDEIEFRYFESGTDAIAALGRQEVQGMGQVPAEALVELGEDVELFSAVSSGYSIAYLNPSAPALRNRSVRQALSLAIDRQSIVESPKLLNGEGVPAAGPIPFGSWAYAASEDTSFSGDTVRAAEILEEAGWIDGDSDGTRDRDGLPLELTLSVADDDARMLPLAKRLQADWQAVGISVTLQPLLAQNVAQTLNQRAFEIFLVELDTPFPDPDPYAFWHSSQVEAPGRNFAGFNNEEADDLLLRARQTHPTEGREERKELYESFQAIFSEEQPAIVIAYPLYNYLVADQGLAGVQIPPLLVNASDRFLTVRDWYGNTAPVLDSAAGR